MGVVGKSPEEIQAQIKKNPQQMMQQMSKVLDPKMLGGMGGMGGIQNMIKQMGGMEGMQEMMQQMMGGAGGAGFPGMPNIPPGLAGMMGKGVPPKMPPGMMKRRK